jgi:hypothetical protein
MKATAFRGIPKADEMIFYTQRFGSKEQRLRTGIARSQPKLTQNMVIGTQIIIKYAPPWTTVRFQVY